MESFLNSLGEEITDANEETFHLFSLPPPPAQALGIVSASSAGAASSGHKSNDHNVLALSIPTGDGTAHHDFEIHPSPALLHSRRAGGTTGAAVWEASLRLAAWISWEGNPLFRAPSSSSGKADEERSPFLGPDTVALELGSGVAGIVPCLLAPRVGRVVATDQEYILKALHANLERNGAVTGNGRDADGAGHPPGRKSPVRASGKRTAAKKQKQQQQQQQSTSSAFPSASSPRRIDIRTLDWETTDVAAFCAAAHPPGPDLVLASDCIYNYALLAPFVQTCGELAAVRQNYISSLSRASSSAAAAAGVGSAAEGGPGSTRMGEGMGKPTLCLIVQQLRQPEVFEEWLEAFLKVFRVWRVVEEVLTEGLREGSGFVVHVGILRSEG